MTLATGFFAALDAPSWHIATPAKCDTAYPLLAKLNLAYPQ